MPVTLVEAFLAASRRHNQVPRLQEAKSGNDMMIEVSATEHAIQNAVNVISLALANGAWGETSSDEEDSMEEVEGVLAALEELLSSAERIRRAGDILVRGGFCLMSPAGALAVVPQEGEFLVIRASDVAEVLDVADDYRRQEVHQDILVPHLTEADAIAAYVEWSSDYTIVREEPLQES
jgi:hypothetical protein